MKGFSKSVMYLERLIEKFNDKGDYHIGDELSWTLEDLKNLQAQNEKLKALILFTDPALSNEQCVSEIQLRQWNEFIKTFPQEN